MSSKSYKNETQYRRTTKDQEHPFTIISQTLIRDTNLNLIEVGIMTYFLSHDDSYILNMTYVQKISGIGQDVFNKSIKHLIELGYVLKVPYFGGVCWIINEIPLQVLNNGTNSEKTKCLSTIRAKTKCLITNCLNTRCLSHRLRSNNEPIQNEEIKIEEDKNETNTNESVLGDSGLESFPQKLCTPPEWNTPSLPTPTGVRESDSTPKVEVKESLTSKIENECQRIITHPNCQHIFINNPQWQVYNEKLFKLSNATIGFEVCKYMLKFYDNPNKQRESEHSQFLNSDEGRFMNYMFYIVKYSQKLESSNIWQSFTHECGLEYKENLINYLTLS
jgi:hypothetical protein